MALDQVTSGSTGGNLGAGFRANANFNGANAGLGMDQGQDRDQGQNMNQGQGMNQEMGSGMGQGMDQGLGAMGDGQLQTQRHYDPAKIFQTFMEGNNVHARLSPSRINGFLRVARDLDIDLRPHGELNQKIVRDSLVTGAVAGAVIGLTMGPKAGLAGLIGTAAATMLVKVCEVDVRIAGEENGQSLLSFLPGV